MPRSMQRVAEAVAKDPAGCAALTVTGLAELTGTSEATVVRTARILGYPGYRDLRLALARLAARPAAGGAPATPRPPPPPPPPSPPPPPPPAPPPPAPRPARSPGARPRSPRTSRSTTR